MEDNEPGTHPEQQHSEILELVDLAIAQCAEGNHADSKATCHRILEHDPHQPDAHRLLGVVAAQGQNFEEALGFLSTAIDRKADFVDAYYDRAFVYQFMDRADDAIEDFNTIVAIQPDFILAYFGMGNLQLGQGEYESAANSYQKSLDIAPEFPEALNNRGVALRSLGRHQDAIVSFEKAISVNPDYLDPYDNLGATLVDEGRANEAVPCLKKAIAINPTHASALNNLGNAFTALSKWDDAIHSYKASLRIEPDFANTYFNLANAYAQKGDVEAAISCHKAAIEKNPSNPSVYVNLGVCLKGIGRLQESVDSFERALSLAPDLALARGHLGLALLALGKVSESVDHFRRAVRTAPDDASIHGNYIHALQYQSDISGIEILEEAKNWDRRHAASPSKVTYRNVRDPDRRLRIGYASADFKTHAAAYFLEPLVEGHDRTGFEVFCYAQVPRPDETTERFKKFADHWRPTVGIDDDALANMIRNDAIDILVECTGHTKNNRRLALSRKPAPIQVNFLALHGETSGMASMDYALADPHFAPAYSQQYLSEEIINLENGTFIFRPDDNWPEVFPTRALSAPPVFACVGAPERVTDEAIDIWVALLERVPGAKLLFKHPFYHDDETLKHWREKFSRLEKWAVYEDVYGGWDVNMEVYGRVDIVLDTLPMTGATSCIIPLWMGVPVLNLASELYCHRMGASVLSCVGASEFIAQNREDYINLAINLINDRERLARLRKELRGRILNAPICDAKSQIGDLENAYRAIWKTWCQQQPTDDPTD